MHLQARSMQSPGLKLTAVQCLFLIQCALQHSASWQSVFIPILGQSLSFQTLTLPILFCSVGSSSSFGVPTMGEVVTLLASVVVVVVVISVDILLVILQIFSPSSSIVFWIHS